MSDFILPIWSLCEICEEISIMSSCELAQAGSNMPLVCLLIWLWQPSETNGSCLISVFQIFYTFHFWPALTWNHLGKGILGILFLAQHISLDLFLQFDFANKFCFFSNITQIQSHFNINCPLPMNILFIFYFFLLH